MRYKFTVIFYTFLITVASVVTGQAQSERKAKRLFESFDYSLAIEEYQKVLTKKEPTVEIAQQLAEAYRLTSRTQQAENWYARVIKFPNPEPVNIFNYAEMLRANGKYAEARTQYTNYAAKVPADAATANALIEAVDRALQWLQKPASAQVNLVKELNSGNADFSPAYYKDGIIFTSDRSTGEKDEKIYGWTGRPYLKLFSSTKTGDTTYSSPTILPQSINGEYHNGPAILPADNNRMYFTRTKQVRKKSKYVNNDPTSWVRPANASDFINRLEIYFADRKGTEWENLTAFPYNNVEEYSVGHPTLSPDEQLLYFASDMPGGSGETDIYYCEKQSDGSWGKPVNAGPVINTAGKEEFPAFGPDGTFYFASDRHPGFGGLDIFSAKGARASWTNVANMYAPLNSSKDDYGILIDSTGKAGLFSSNRSSDIGTADIFSFRLLQKPAIIAVTTLERKQATVKTKVTLVPLPEVRLKLTRQNLTDSTIALSDVNGKHNFSVTRGFNYTVVGSKELFLTQSKVVAVDTTSQSDTVRVELIFDRSDLNKPIVLENIYFDLDKYNIRPDAAAELDKLVQVLKDNPRIRIEMGAHCDSREGLGYNQILSENRAKATVNYLVSKGIRRNRLTARGYGETRPINRCTDGVQCSEAEHQMNRRTEFRIIGR
ncbi:OmpA family protein [Adhaeribacter aquaticus]|uniref:OmpA family protein n=1 Tax=Adhaeribacter aquaticus TaxID=299567 RepID=UPI00068808D8|nr:OmpA family protein [Adhaeribacter aquaticus]